MRALSALLVGCSVAVLAGPASAARPNDPASPPPLEFNRDVRPILSNRCYHCHGPDALQRKGDLRLDRPDGLEADRGGYRILAPGRPEESELLRRATSGDPAERMPPPETGHELTAAEVATLRRWISEGAAWQPHWSLVPPKAVEPPAVARTDWPRGPLDRFILARLEREGLAPAPEADRVALARRVALDLTGLPPTPEEVDAFLADASPNAYERYVDRLLASPHHAERLALDWLDAARFADTHGFHIDSARDMTVWREWVIRAFERNQPFDQFTVEQLAGDLLPGATESQRVATGFHRNHMINFEGGAIPEEYHHAYLVDRVNTTATVWLGLTLGCTQCHDHKYDPFTQKEFYQLYAFFHQVAENGLDGRAGNAVPLLKLPSPAQRQQQTKLNEALAAADARVKSLAPAADRAQAAWEPTATSVAPVAWQSPAPVEYTARGGATLAFRKDGAIEAAGPNAARETYEVWLPVRGERLTAIRVELLADERLPGGGPGRSSNGNIVMTGVQLALGDGNSHEPRNVALTRATADFEQATFPVAAALDRDPGTGWGIHPQMGRDHAAVFSPAAPVDLAGARYARVTLEFQSPFGQHQPGRFRVSWTAAEDPHGERTLSPAIRAILALPAARRTPAQQTELREFYRSRFQPDLQRAAAEAADLRKQLQELDGKVASTMVMQDLPQPRETFVMIRGEYDKRGEQVSAGVPAALPPLPEGAPANRLGLARWLVDPGHPLTARVTVNRYWQMFFGTGLVKTVEDFGSQGEWPSHPELLDWLATDFVSHGWDVRRLVRAIVTSAAYRQASRVTPELLARDPENRLLARGPRVRLQAEFIRDQALAASGLLDRRIGGASVFPYQPAGLWDALAYGGQFSAQSYTPSHGADLYRRSMYTFWKRTVPPPSLSTFDAPDREVCTVRRSRTNTPLQALVLLNDPTYVEAARKLAERALTEADASAEARIERVFRLVLVRPPKPAEIDVLRRLLDRERQHFAERPDEAAKLLSTGESPRNESLDAAELAAWTVVASTVLNLDAAVTKE